MKAASERLAQIRMHLPEAICVTPIRDLEPGQPRHVPRPFFRQMYEVFRARGLQKVLVLTYRALRLQSVVLLY